jgi:SSS family transporter
MGDKIMVENASLLLISMFLALACFMYIGWLAGKKSSSTSADYMAAGGNMSFTITTATLLATFICGGTVLGGAGVAYSQGLQATIPDPFAACLCLIAGGFIFQGIIRKTGALSAASVYADRYGQIGGFVSGLCTIWPMLFFAGAQVAATGKLFQILLGWDFVTIAIASGIFVIIYTVFGGITAVAWTDFVQVSLLILGVVALFPIMLGLLNGMGGHEAVVELMGEDFFSFGLKGDYSFAGIISYLALWIGASAGAMPGADLVQRGLVAKSPKVARWSSVTAGILMTIIGIMVVYIGAWSNLFVANGYFTEAELSLITSDPELLVPLLATHLLSPALQALFYVGLLGAIMSSADSALFAPATIVSNDIVRPLVEKKTGKPVEDQKLTLWTRYAVIGLGLIATFFGAFTQSVFTLMVIGFTIQIVLFFPLLLALYWKKANKTGGVVGMIVGMATCFVLLISQGTIDYDPYWVIVFVPLLTSLLGTVIGSYVTAQSDPPVPLTHRDGSIIKWPELAVNSSKHQADIQA